MRPLVADGVLLKIPKDVTARLASNDVYRLLAVHTAPRRYSVSAERDPYDHRHTISDLAGRSSRS